MNDNPTAEDQLRTHTRAALEAAGVSQAEVARQFGLSTKHVSHMLIGRATLTLTWAEAILSLAGQRIEITTRPDPEETP
ncbi:helix-turn-helix domain-containing protein [Streptomyces sp. NPDC006640]|uniref:helix-turn-helix domain-containing protein n=1 Tax=unclassified Streptomyces TaxID=2593676 RepID=UPI00368FC89E